MPFAAPGLVELCALAGFDYVIIDLEHGAIDVGECEGLVRAAEVAEVTPIARVATTEQGAILRLLDAGVQGLMVPHVSSRADAERAVAAAMYPPLGHRGAGSMRAAAYGQKLHRRDWVRHANEEMLVIAMLEDADAVRNVSEILAVQGLDAFEIGTGDLSLSMGVPGETSHPKVEAAVEQMVATILDAGKIVGDTANDPETARLFVNRGYRMIDCGFVNVTTGALRHLVTAMRKDIPTRALRG